MESLRDKAMPHIISILRTNEAKLFLLTLLVYSLTLSLHFQYSQWLGWVHIHYGWDGHTYSALTRSIIVDGDFFLDAEYEYWYIERGTFYVIVSEGTNGHYYSMFFPGVSFFMIPFYIIGGKSGIIFTNIIVSSSLIVVIYRLCKLYVDKTISFWISILMGFCTMIWIYSNTLFSEPLAGLLITLSTYLSINSVKNQKPKKSILAGLSSGFAILVRASSFLAGILILVYLVFRREKERSILYVLFAAIGITILGVYDLVCFGSFLKSGYNSVVYPSDLEPHNQFLNQWKTPTHIGVYGLLFDSVHGLISLSPLLFLSFLGFCFMYKKERAETLLLFLIFVSTLLLYAHWEWWWGGYCFSARYCYPVLPILSVPLAILVQKYQNQTIFRVALGFLALLSFLITFAGLNYYYWVASPLTKFIISYYPMVQILKGLYEAIF